MCKGSCLYFYEMYIEDAGVSLRGGALARTLKTLVELGMGMPKHLRPV